MCALKTPTKRRRASPEHDMQVAFFKWWSYYCKSVKLDHRLMYAVPNAGAGAQKGQAGKLKAEGVKAGMPDVNLDVARNGYHGLRLEFKVWPRKPEPYQLEVIALLRKQCFGVGVVYSLEDAMRLVKEYLRGQQ